MVVIYTNVDYMYFSYYETNYYEINLEFNCCMT
jgi:hypothetical protein